MEWDDEGVCREMICDIGKGCVKHLLSARCYVCKSAYTCRDNWKQHCKASKVTLG
jgi:hypothetical protein